MPHATARSDELVLGAADTDSGAKGNRRRQSAMEQALVLGGDEKSVVAFILSCNVSEARFAAAQHVHGRMALRQLRNAMRETDRRVAKLMQSRLDALARRERSDQQARTVLEDAQQLCDAVTLLPNQVIDLERSWSSIEAASVPAQQAFEVLHKRLSARLLAQLALQRQALDAIKTARGALASPVPNREAIAAAASATSATLEKARSDVEGVSLPNHLVPELSLLHSRLQRLHDDALADLAAIAAREVALLSWEQRLLPLESPSATDVGPGARAAVIPAVPSPAPLRKEGSEIPSPAAMPARVHESPESMLLTWRGLPAVGDVEAMQRLQTRFDALLQSPALATPLLQQQVSLSRPLSSHAITQATLGGHVASDRADNAQRRQQFGAALDALQAALDEGALQKALEHDRSLRSININVVELAPALRSALGTARAELGRLQGWAKWGGTVSREELLSAVETLPQQAMPVEELAKKVGSMRERWRALDALAGAGPRASWTRFDEACTNAYAPAAAHFAALAQARVANAQTAQALLDDAAAVVNNFGRLPSSVTARNRSGWPPVGSTDWRAIAAFRLQTLRAWRQVGPLERREQKRLDAAFAQIMQPLDAALDAQQQFKLCQRVGLIEEITRLPPQARETPERLQALQTLWQSHAKSFPLPRPMEQDLWQRFRDACDAVFSERKLASATADAERKNNLRAKTALCELLEKAAADTALGDRESVRVVHEARARWSAVGQVPRAVLAALQARFNAAVRMVEAQPTILRQAALRRDCSIVRQRLALCQECENRLISGISVQSAMRDAGSTTSTVEAFRAQWSAMPSLAGETGAALAVRFETAMAAMACNAPTHARALQDNQPARDAVLLRLEVAAGIDSPAAFVRERLAIQVAGLRSTFKDGIALASESGFAQLAKLLAIPAYADPAAQSRLNRLLEAFAGSNTL